MSRAVAVFRNGEMTLTA